MVHSSSVSPTPTAAEADDAPISVTPEAMDATVDVTLLLDGGHEYQLTLEQDAPSLRKLFAILLQTPEKRCKRLFQLPINAPSGTGNSQSEPALCFTGDRLVGIITDPPIYIQQPDASDSDASDSDASDSDISRSDSSRPNGSNFPSNAESSGTEKSANATSYSLVASPEREEALPAGVIPSRYIQITNFLDHGTYQRLLDFTLTQQAAFVGSSTSTGDVSYRKSSVLHHFPEFSNMMVGEIHAAFAHVIAALKLTPFGITQVEAQLTAHNHGNYYKVHNDNGSEDTATRMLTYVYYFYQEPKSFSGGPLRIYDSRIENNYYVQADFFQDVMPINNSIVFFPSHYMHEVLPIECPSKEFAHSRFTINGWVRR